MIKENYIWLIYYEHKVGDVNLSSMTLRKKYI